MGKGEGFQTGAVIWQANAAPAKKLRRSCRQGSGWGGITQCAGHSGAHPTARCSMPGFENPASADGDQSGTGGQDGKHQHGRVESTEKEEGKQQRALCKEQRKRQRGRPPAGRSALRLPQARTSAAWPRCATLPPGWRHGTAPPHRGRSLRSNRTGWRHPARTGFRQSPCRHGRGGRFLGQRFGGKHKRSWQWAAARLVVDEAVVKL